MEVPLVVVAEGRPDGGRLRASLGLLRPGPLPEWALLPLAAAVWWAGGHLWWLLAGLDGATGTDRSSALPLGASWLSSLVLGALAGGVGAGLLGRLAPRRGRALAATGAGVLLAVVVSLLQSLTAVGEAAGDGFAGEPVVLGGLCAVVAGTAAGGWALGSCALLGRPGLGVALGVLAGVAPPWSSAVVTAASPPTGSSSLGTVSAWVGAAVLVGALLAVGAHPPVRLAWWPLVLVLAWSTGPTLTAAAYLEPLLRPGYGLPESLPDALSGAWQVFELASSPDARYLVPWWVASGVALVAALTMAFVVPTARRGSTPPPGAEAPQPDLALR